MEEKITRIITKVAITAFLAGLFCLGMSVNAKADARAYQSMLNQQYQITLATYDNVIAYQQYEAAYAAQLYQQSLAMQQYQQMLAAQRNMYLNEVYNDALIQQRTLYNDVLLNKDINNTQLLGIYQTRVQNSTIMPWP